jgi:hypothetical protein
VAGETDGGYLQRAELLADLGRCDDVVDELRSALALDPRDAVAPSLLASVHLAADRPAEALDAADAQTLGRLAEAAAAPPAVAEPSPVDGLRQLVRHGATFTIVAVLFVGFRDAANGFLARVLAVVFGTVGVFAVARYVRHGSNSGWIGFSVLAGPAFVLAFGLVGGPWPPVFAILSAALSQLAMLARARG